MGFRQLATQYYERYRVPIFHCETNRVSHLAVEWLDQQWSDILAMRASGIPVMGFTWYSLTDQIDWQHALRVERNDLHAVGHVRSAPPHPPGGRALQGDHRRVA